jgi:acyl carrier protein
MDKIDIEKIVQAMLVSQLKTRGMRFNVKKTDSIIGAGILDSLSALELVAELEKKFGISISPEEMTETNFDTIAKISDFISTKI